MFLLLISAVEGDLLFDKEAETIVVPRTHGLVGVVLALENERQDIIIHTSRNAMLEPDTNA